VDLTLDQAEAKTERLTIVLMHSHIGIGTTLHDDHRAHGSPVGPEYAGIARGLLGWPYEPSGSARGWCRWLLSSCCSSVPRPPRDAILPPRVRWSALTPEVVAMTTYGRSGKGPDLYRLFGITSQAVAAKAQQILSR
jgi:transketolase